MKIGTIECHYVIKKFEHHERLKQSILHEIDLQESTRIHDEQTHITRSDWIVEFYQQRPYWDLISPLIMEHMQSISGVIRLEDIPFHINNWWYHQYYKNDTHAWHTHSGCQWSNCYYVELPDESQRTIFKDANGNMVIPEVEEGDILTFPSSIMHTSPKNEVEERKTIIAWNVT